jgi:N-acetyl-gamma-glutamyl-phosphate reductase / acetylglutamate kinase
VWVLALPNGLCAEHAAAIDQRSKAQSRAPPLLLDLSADMRFDKTGAWAYGMPERPGARAALRHARRIANPGCYATGSQLALLPLLQTYAGSAFCWDSSAKPHIFGVSGYSGYVETPHFSSRLPLTSL